MRRLDRLYLAAFGFYAALAFILLYPLIFHNGTRVAGFDFFNYNWNFWWIRHAFSTPGLLVYQSDFVFHPLMNNFGYHALAAFWYPVWALVEPLAGSLTAINLIILIGCIANGFLLFIWLRDEGVRPALALLGGAALQVLPISRYFYYNTHLNLMDWFWLPAMLLLWKRLVVLFESRRYPLAFLWSVIIGIAIWGLGLTDLQFPIFAGAVLIPYGVWTLWRSPARLWLIAGGVIAVAVGLGLLIVAGPLPYMARFTGTLAPGPAEERPGIPFPEGFFTMSDQWWEWSQPSLGSFVAPVFLITLVAWALVKPKTPLPPSTSVQTTPLFWLVVALPPFLFSLGADLRIGSLTIPLPFRLLHEITDGMFRMPWRLAPIFVIAAALFCGQVWSSRLPQLNTRRNPPRLVFALAGTFIFLGLGVRLFETAPLLEAPYPYQAYQTMRDERGGDYDRYMVLDVPIGVGTGEVLLGDPRAIQLQYYGIVHQKRTLNGFVSRAPVDPLWEIYTLDPLWAWLGQRQPLDAGRAETLLRERVFNYPVGYIVIHTRLLDPYAPTLGEIVGFMNRVDDIVCPPTVEHDIIVYRTRWHPDGCPSRRPPQTASGGFQVDIGGYDTPYLGAGWYPPEPLFDLSIRWTGLTEESTLYFDLPPGGYQVTFTAQAFHQARQVTVLLNGTTLGQQITVPPDSFGTFTVDLPASLVGSGEHLALAFRPDRVLIPADLGQGTDQRSLAIMLDSVIFTPVD